MSDSGSWRPTQQDHAELDMLGANEPQAPGTNVYAAIDATERDLGALAEWLANWQATKTGRTAMLDDTTQE
jgi:hypothetical protein